VRTFAALTVAIVSLTLAPAQASAQTRPAVVHQGASYARTHGYTVGIAVLDTKTGRFYGSGDYRGLFDAESIAKVFIATRLLMRGEMVGPTRRLAYKMITESDDSIATALYGRVGGDSLINWVKTRFDVPGLGLPPRRSGWWGHTRIRAAGLVRLYAKLARNAKVGPWLLNAMRHTTEYAADGTYQFFGIPAATKRAAIKQGWNNQRLGDRTANFNTTGFVNNDQYAVAILARGPRSSYGKSIGALLTAVAQRLLPHGHFPDPVPHLTALSTTTGRTAGGSTVIVRGTDLTHVTAVLFGSHRATQVQSLSPNRLRAVVPAHQPGAVGIRVVTNHGKASGPRFTYVAPPVVTTVDPAAGPSAGGNVITVRGSGFYPATAVQFGVTKAPHVHVISPTQLTVTVPAHDPGVVDISVRSDYGTSAADKADQYTYTDTARTHHRRRG
jgi:hypothetical protein